MSSEELERRILAISDRVTSVRDLKDNFNRVYSWLELKLDNRNYFEHYYYYAHNNYIKHWYKGKDLRISFEPENDRDLVECAFYIIKQIIEKNEKLNFLLGACEVKHEVVNNTNLTMVRVYLTQTNRFEDGGINYFDIEYK